MIFRQLFDPQSSTYSYLLGDEASRQALLIDPVFAQARRDAALIQELGLTLAATLETHVHADHVTGAWMLKQHLGSSMLVPAQGGAAGADRALAHGDRAAFGPRFVEARATPGHTRGCMTYVLDDRSMAFTGDCVLIRGSGRTDFQEGDARAMYRSVHEEIMTLPPACLLYPAHDYRGLTVTSVAEEMRFNPRLGGNVGESDFVGYMRNLRLPHPGLIDIAVPANLRCGRPDTGVALPADPDWAALSFTFAGFWEIAPRALEEAAAGVQIVDVREPDEFVGSLGHIHGARLIPLGDLPIRLAELSRDQPVVTVCRSGARSAQATVSLQQAGFAQVANLMGGMLRWRAEGLAVEGGKA
ncbi:MAG: rhodanese-like domain-containing protein [Betaproteobacteria bacterium]